MSRDIAARQLFSPAGFVVSGARMVRPGASAELAKPLPLDRAKQLTKPFAGDDALDTWAARMIAAADDFQKNKRSDPLGSFLPTHKRDF